MSLRMFMFVSVVNKCKTTRAYEGVTVLVNII
jgi:hypothetical protein